MIFREFQRLNSDKLAPSFGARSLRIRAMPGKQWHARSHQQVDGNMGMASRRTKVAQRLLEELKFLTCEFHEHPRETSMQSQQTSRVTTSKGNLGPNISTHPSHVCRICPSSHSGNKDLRAGNPSPLNMLRVINQHSLQFLYEHRQITCAYSSLQ